jgi:hypothetical protein
VKLKKKTVKSSNIKSKNQKKTKKRPYFGKDAHNAVVRYQDADCRNVKNKIYTADIKPSFEKLAENLIFIHGFSYSQNHFVQLKNDCVSFLFEILEKFDPAKGSKAFSYFNVCAKNFLIIQSKKRVKNRNRHVSIHDENLSFRDKSYIESHQISPSPEDSFILKEEIATIHIVNEKLKDKITNSNEKLCIDAIITLFNSIEDLDFLNKRAVFVYLREISGLNPKQLSVAMSGIRKQYRELAKNNDEYVLFKR